MAIKKFGEYAEEFKKNKSVESEPLFQRRFDKPSFEAIKQPTVKESKAPIKPSKINEGTFLVDDTYKVKIVADVPKSLVDEYIKKVKAETDKNPLDNFSEAEIAEQMVVFSIEKFMLIDNMTPDFTVGNKSVGQAVDSLQSDEQTLNTDLETGDEQSDSDIEFDDFNAEDDGSDGEIDFSDNEKTVGDVKTHEPVDNGFEKESDSDPDSNFDEIHFSDEDSNDGDIPNTVGDLKKKQQASYDQADKDDKSGSHEEEEELNDIYARAGYRTGFFENLDVRRLGGNN